MSGRREGNGGDSGEVLVRGGRRGGKALDKYLSRYVEPEADAVRSLFGHPRRDAYAGALVIPAFAEGEGVLRTLKSIPRPEKGPALVVLVLNAGEKACRSEQEATAESFDAMDAWLPCRRLEGCFASFEADFGTLLVVKRYGESSLRVGEGVGKARKIGADILLRLWVDRAIADPWIRSSDADVILPRDYWRCLEPVSPSVVGATYPFAHADDCLHTRQAIVNYELSIRYYVLGLSLSHSPYAFHTIGSTLAFTMDAYAKVRGIPNRRAGEDFYLMNKLAQIGKIQRLQGNKILLSSRESRRTPFGTGASLIRLREIPFEEMPLYHPDSFLFLKAWLMALRDVLNSKYPPMLEHCFVNRLQEMHLDCDRGLRALMRLNILDRLHLLIEQSPPHLMRALHTLFDGFRTLKFIHALREEGLTMCPAPDALRRPPFRDVVLPASTPRGWLRSIERLDEKMG